MRILLVDDDQDIRCALANVFQKAHDHSVIEASSGFEAISTLASNNDFSLVISDYQMDNGNGDVIVNFLKTKNINLPFIFFSASPEILNADLNSPVLKTFSKSEIFQLIDYVEEFKTKMNQQNAV